MRWMSIWSITTGEQEGVDDDEKLAAPGPSVRHDCIEPLGLTITEAAEALGVTRQTLNNLVNGRHFG